MTKFKKAAISILTAAALACSVLGAAACGGDYPDFINPSSQGGPTTPGDTNGGYTVNVKSEGGLNLDGVMIHAKKDGKTVATGYSKSGKINFDVPAGKYELVVDQSNLPAGYYVPEGAHFSTPETGNETTVYLPSKIIETSVGSGVMYSVGQVMNTFSFVDTTGERHTLTELAQGKKLIVLNFWATWCGPCVGEFGALKEAYTAYKDMVEVIALSTSDSIGAIRTFYNANNINFYMGEDSSNLYNHFGTGSIPLTVFIDRYGVIANIHNSSIPSASQWGGMFATYTSNDYVQNPETSGNEGDVGDIEKPNIASPDPEDLARASLSTTSNEGKITDFGEDMSESDKEYNWPWIPQVEGDREYLSATNVGKKYSYSMFTANVKMNSGDILSFDYKIKINGGDAFAVILDNIPIAQYTGETTGWQTVSRAYVATHDIEAKLVVAYQRGNNATLTDEIAAIDNLKIVHASEAGISVDIPVALVSGSLQQNGKYETYGEVELNEDDGFYHDKATGNLVVADLRNSTLWTERVVGKTFIGTDEQSHSASLYNLAYFLMSNYRQLEDDHDTDIELAYDFGHTDALHEYYYLQMFSDTEYVPVTQDLKDTMVAFLEMYCDRNEKDYYDEQWLEFCYIFKHYGGEHAKGDVCYEKVDPTAGRGRHNAYVAVEDELNKVDITHTSTYNGGGLYYKFTPSKTGVYKFVSSENVYKNSLGDTEESDPALMVEDENGTILYYFNSDQSYDKVGETGANYFGYGELQAGKTYYLHSIMGYIGKAGKYSFQTTYVGTSYDHLVTCTDGSWADDGNYNAISVALGSDGYYHQVDRAGKLKSIVYLDFVHVNHLDSNGHSVYEMVKADMFNMLTTFGLDYTADMERYYDMSIEGKDPSDELYGLVPVDQELCDILVAYTQVISLEGDGRGSNYWLSTCCYYQHYGA